MYPTSEVPVILLCGGLGTRLREATVNIPKPMVPIGNHPIIWHIMKSYSFFGFRKFILCLGYKSEVIKDYFLNYSALNSDFTIDLKSNDVEVHSVDHNEDWEVTLAFTGEENMTGSRVYQAATRYLGDSEHFAVSYGDGLTNVNLRNEFSFHLDHNRIGTILGVNPISRFGELKVTDNVVTKFSEKPKFEDQWINGGYMFFKKEFLKYLGSSQNCVLEQKPMINLARDQELAIYKHEGFWACMDTQRDFEYLNGVWSEGNAPWQYSETIEASKNMDLEVSI